MSSKKLSYDTHHLCFSRRQWNKGYVKSIRNYWYFIVLIPKNTLHAKIHQEIDSIPVPKECSAKRAYEAVRALDKHGAFNINDPIEDRLDLLAKLFDADDPRTADALRKQASIIHGFKKAPH